MKAFQASILYKRFSPFYLFIFLFLVAACQSNKYKISGTAEGLEDGDTLFLTSNMQTGEPSDTIVIHDGKFSLSGTTDSVHLAMLYSARQNEANAPFFVEPGTITIRLSAELGASRVSGTLCNDQWQVLNDSVMSIGREINRIAEHIYGNNLPQEEQQKGMEKIDQLNQRFAALVVKTAEKNVGNEFGYFLLTYYPEELIDNDTRARLIGQLPAEMRQRPAVRELEKALSAARQTAEGATMPDFTLPSPEGDSLSLLAEVKQHKLTVIDFWASWCGPCRQEMPTMVQLYDQYQSKGLGIVGISLDSDRDAWLTATKQLGIAWPQMSDLKGWENAAAKQMNVNSIPHTVVVDQKGKILRRGLRGEALQQFVASQLK